jgi:hypothetical protein
VCGSREITVFFAVGVAGQATLTDLFGGSLFERENLRCIAPTFDVLLPWTVAGFAAVPLGPLLRIEGRHEVRRVFEGLVEPFRRQILMTRLAGFRANKPREIAILL